MIIRIVSVIIGFLFLLVVYFYNDFIVPCVPIGTNFILMPFFIPKSRSREHCCPIKILCSSAYHANTKKIANQSIQDTIPTEKRS